MFNSQKQKTLINNFFPFPKKTKHITKYFTSKTIQNLKYFFKQKIPQL